MARSLFLAACFASALLSCVSGEMMEQSQQYQPGQQGQQMNGQQMGGAQSSGQEMGSTQMSEPKGKNGDMQGDKDGNGGGANTMMNVANPVIIIATNAGGNSQTQQMNTAVQPPQATHTVTVGGPSGLIYSPESVQAAQYDMIQFNFMSKNHTVTQSTFQEPCKKMQPMPMPAGGMPVAAGMPAAGMPAAGMPAAGMPSAGSMPMTPPIDSGFMPTTDTGPSPMLMLQVTSPPSTPMWFYCRQKLPKPHCGSGNGMTFSINPHQPGMGDKTQAAFKARAMMGMANSTSAGAGVAAASAGVAAASGVQMQVAGTMQQTTTTATMTAATNMASSQNQAMGQQQASQPPPQMQAPASSPSPAPMAQTPASPQPAASSPNNTPMAQGTGQTTTNGACECSCLCGAAAFPNAMQGLGMTGGMPGAVPVGMGAGMGAGK